MSYVYENSAIKTLVFRPFQQGEVMEVSPGNIARVIEGDYEISSKNFGVDGVVVFVNSEPDVLEKPRHREVNGIFVVSGYEDNKYVSLTDGQITSLINKLNDFKNYDCIHKYFTRFFNQKEIQPEFFQYNREGHLILLSNYDVMDNICASGDIDFLKDTEDILTKLDFANENINLFLEHIGNAMADIIKLQYPDIV